MMLSVYPPSPSTVGQQTTSLGSVLVTNENPNPSQKSTVVIPLASSQKGEGDKPPVTLSTSSQTGQGDRPPASLSTSSQTCQGDRPPAIPSKHLHDVSPVPEILIPEQSVQLVSHKGNIKRSK
jgi:hypothetical protein